MITIISPAKSMDSSKGALFSRGELPLFVREASELALLLSKYDRDDIKELFKVSDKIAELTFERYRLFDSSAKREALYCYVGSVFKHIAPADFSSEEVEFAHSHLVILSVLYGLLRACDEVKEYRLEYKTKLEGLGCSLYDYWKPRLTQPLIDMVKGSGGVLINLGSLDLLPALDLHLLGSQVRVITIDFKVFKGGKYVNVQTYSKMERGEMVRYIIKNKIDNPEELKLFNNKGFSFNESLSSSDNYIFTSGS